MGTACAPVVPCATDAQCPAGLCDPEAQRCVQCFDDSHCPAATPVCLRNACAVSSGSGGVDLPGLDAGETDANADGGAPDATEPGDGGEGQPDVAEGGADSGADAGEGGGPDASEGGGANDADAGDEGAEPDAGQVPAECVEDRECADTNPCTNDRCTDGFCVNAPSTGKACDDANECTIDTFCANGKCVGTALVCNDGSPCTNDFCENETGCVYGPLHGPPCDDGNDCSEDDTCIGGVCKGKGPDCSDDNPCTEDNCEGTDGCTHFGLTGAPCDDGNPCTQGDTCSKGVCVGTPKACDDFDSCTIDKCNPFGQCTHSPVSGPCDDGNACTEEDECELGDCEGLTKNCGDKNPCTTDTCDPVLGCQYKNLNIVTCSDGNVCTEGDACQFGVCIGTPKDCDDNKDCTLDACNASGVCTHAGLTASPGDPFCSDGNACTKDDRCESGVCKGTPVVCPADGNPCTTDACNQATGACDYPFVAAACNDGQSCTQFDQCKLIDGTPTCSGSPGPNNQACFLAGGGTGKCQQGQCVP
jgi:hypothetical protein